MAEKDEIIAQTYHDTAGFGSVLDTYRKAHARDASITVKDVAQWKERYVERKKQLRGYNSFVAHKPREEYQIDL